MQSLPEPSASTPADLNPTLGAVFIGTMLGLVLYGMTMQQAIFYFRTYTKDDGILKAWVTTIIVAETLHSLFSVHPCYYFLVSNYSHPEVLIKNIWSLNLLAPLQAVAMILCQAFYARRIVLIRPRWSFGICVVSAILMAAELGFSIAAAVKPFQNTFTFEFNRFKWLIIAINACAIPTDVILTTGLIFILVRSKTGFRRSDSLIKTLVLYTINTGLLTGIVTATTLILSLASPETSYYIGMSLCGTKVYSNTFLAMLNSRQMLANKMVDEFDALNTYTLEALPPSALSARVPMSRHRARQETEDEGEQREQILDIKVTREQVSDSARRYPIEDLDRKNNVLVS